MANQNQGKLNRLGQLLPEGLIVTAAWLEERQYSRSLRSHYVSAGWLTQPARGVFRRGYGPLRWEQVVISLQTLLGVPVIVGGRSALTLQGHAHYLFHGHETIHMYGDGALPTWVHKLPLTETFAFHNRSRLLPGETYRMPALPPPSEPMSRENDHVLPGALQLTHWGPSDWPLVVSTTERAILELLDDLPDKLTFHLADVTMEGLVNLSPRRMQTLLEDTRSIKVKRLFLYFAERHGHRWLSHIDQQSIDIGEGKRSLAKGGRYVSKYRITVPRDLDGL